ncbi:HPP family protein, partial [Novosphingobium sp.]|uniref:HPP family protein n=1 Tax=Novosphingobium sp. TaxID=1874826 RepID=UPI0035AE7DA9
LGIGFAGVTSWLLLGDGSVGLPLLVAPLGASAVLVFAVPASPLAQPWSVIGGSLISGAIGLATGHFLGAPVLSASIAVGLAIAVMSMLRCLHPPGGACALLCALGATGHDPWGWPHWICIAANVCSLVAAGWLVNNLTGHPWPHKVPLPAASAATIGVREALEKVLADWDEMIDADIDDLTALFEAVDRQIRRQPYPAPARPAASADNGGRGSTVVGPLRRPAS